MSANDINVIIGAFVMAAGIIGAGIKWLLTYIDGQQSKAELIESCARTDLSNRLYDEIKLLRIELTNSHKEKQLYLRRILQLEAYIHNQQNLIMPKMDGWPPID